MHLRPSWRTNNKKKLKGAYQGQIDVEVKSFAGFIAFHNLLIFFGKVETNKKKEKRNNQRRLNSTKWEKKAVQSILYIFFYWPKMSLLKISHSGEGVRGRLNYHILTKSVLKRGGGGEGKLR